MVEEKIGTVAHYWPKVSAASLDLARGELRVGDRVRIKGRDHEFVQEVQSIQIDHEPRREAHPGENAAISVAQPVHEHDEVFLVRE